jgi:hypothetical protein
MKRVFPVELGVFAIRECPARRLCDEAFFRVHRALNLRFTAW